MLSIKYRAAEKVVQTIPDEYMDGRPKEVNNRDIMARVREMRIPFKARTSPTCRLLSPRERDQSLAIIIFFN